MLKKMVQFEITDDLIKTSLALPEETLICNIVKHSYKPGVFIFYVEHPSFKEVKNGELSPVITPIFTVNHKKKPLTWLTVDFNNTSEQD